MENQKKSKGMTALVVLLLIITIAALILATFAWARYTSSSSNTATAQVAKWNVSFSDGNDTFVGDYKHVVDTKIAPGTSGTFDITVNPGSTEVCFDYTIQITGVKFYNGTTLLTDASVLKERTAAEGGNVTLGMFKPHIVFKDAAGNDITDGTNVITGTYDLGGSTHNTTTDANLVTGTNGKDTVTWTWEYKSDSADANVVAEYDAIDTAAGEFAAKTGNDFKMEVSYKVTAVQVQPNANAHNNA